jgi:sugar phosphate isomerase/epimerase
MCTDHLESHEPAGQQEMRGLLGRRGFLRATAATAAVTGAVGTGALAAPAGAATATTTGGHGGRRRVPVDQISIQLYTVRDILSADPAGTIATLRDIGYRKVEAAGTAGLTAAEFRALLDQNGIRATSAHLGIPQPFDATAWKASLADAKTLGCRYVVHPFFGVDANGPIRDAAVWTQFAKDLNKAGYLARQAGFEFGYHNHHFEFLPVSDGSGRRPFDIITRIADRRLVHLEVDIYWAWRGAADPVDIIHANPGRVRQFHVKDMNIESGFTDPGTGLIDFGRVFAQGHVAGIKEFIVERDDAGTGDRTPAQALDTAAVGYQFLRNIRF